MDYKLALTCSLRDLKKLRRLSAESRKSKDTWTAFMQSVSVVPDTEYTLPSRRVDFMTLIRSVRSNKMIAFGNNTMCTVRTCEPLHDKEMSLDDICITNAYKAYTQSVQCVNMDKQITMMNSTAQIMGVVNYHDWLSVYLNVIVDDTVFDSFATPDFQLCTGAQIIPIQSFTPIDGSREDLISDSLIIVRGEHDNE